MEANISAKDNKNDEYIHKFNPKKKDFCPSLEDENDLFTQIWHALGLKKIVCSIKAVSIFLFLQLTKGIFLRALAKG